MILEQHVACREWRSATITFTCFHPHLAGVWGEKRLIDVIPQVLLKTGPLLNVLYVCIKLGCVNFDVVSETVIKLAKVEAAA